MWKKITDSDGIICYEKHKEGLAVRLEARFEDGEWVIYKGYTADNMNHTEEYSVPTREDAEKLMLHLKNEKVPSLAEIGSLLKKKHSRADIRLKRAYKEENLEKWFFSVGNDKASNFFIIREFEKLEMDIVMHEKYRSSEEEILKAIVRTLSLDEFDLDLDQTVYYFNRLSSHSSHDKRKKFFLDKFEVEYDFKN